ncbi:MAG: NB-ARC domain-containing protein [Tychonema bourrellyi B0820]|uniref:ATPase n=1 Tax=Tychonema bourrellyi FEM_GT703 TaxID=2040638 RepID=A0A2G4EZA5_9CYAN|nr:NB-ARC domain-containing protein [Tychonema bourrellyi]MDQ2098580.1 NB-ARC domain-containing protein [Tychonema bourrellyi B0820]PHX54841.1 ATPase [Tychonema bourrellyi FEM_GT703]
MDVKELSKWTDEQVFAKTGQHLDSLHKSILESVLQRQSFHKIAGNNGYSYDHVKKEGAKLWKLLSAVFSEEIEQKNVRSILENQAGSTIYSFGNSSLIISNHNINKNHVNICRENPQSLEDIEKRSPSSQVQNQLPIIYLTTAPELNYNYGRNSEIHTLKEWILEDKTRLITIYGLSGIGKTALTLKLISEINTQFDYIIYRSLEHLPKLIDLKDELKQFFSQSHATPLPEIIDYFRSSRCLVILDDVQNIFKTGNFAGQYLTDYKDYCKFFQQIATLSHQSCLILISWEKPGEIETLEKENKHTRVLQIQGLGEEAKEILRQKDLQDEEKWEKLITLYQSHPAWLNIICSTIIEFLNGSVSLFLTDENELFLGDIETNLESQLERLSELEKNVINWLANQDEPIDISQKPANMEVSQAKFMHILQSLTRRCLVEKVPRKEPAKFQLNSIFKAHIKSDF